MCEISLNLENRHGAAFRDDASASLNDAEFFVSARLGAQFRLTAASSADLLRARIVLKKGRRGARLANLIIDADGSLRSKAVIFQLKEVEISSLNSAPDKMLLIVWRRVLETCRWFEIDERGWSAEHLKRATATILRGAQ
ncbi:protein of unknown function [Hyphomicrobium sp. MC1]|nr:protein of unknown function [Hyphomicrobium sp. MC1]